VSPGATTEHGRPIVYDCDAIRRGHLQAARGFEHHGRQVCGPLPAFIERAKEEEAVRQALAGVGYRRVRAALLRQKREDGSGGVFLGLKGGLSPSLDFVEDWLKDERTRIRAQVRSTFFIGMMSAISVGLGLAIGLMISR